MSEMPGLPTRLNEIIEDMRGASREEKLELLLDFANTLPVLPEWLQGKRDEMEQVHECMTPVFVYAERSGQRLVFHLDVPPESPTVRGFAELLRQGLNGATPEQVLQVPDDLAERMQLQNVLSPRRVGGLRYLLAHMKRLAIRNVA